MQPRKGSLSKIQQLEEFLGVEKGDLTNCLPMIKGRRPTGLTTYGRKMLEAKKTRYGVWTDAIEEEWKEFVAFKSRAIPKEGELRGRNAVWTSSSGADLPSEAIMRGYLRCFFGYCCLPVDHENPQMCGLGMRREEMSLSLLADKTIVEGYSIFSMVRAGGKYHNGQLSYLASVLSILHPEYGYLPQHPEIAGKFNNTLTDEAWREKCADTFKRISVVNSNILYLRDSESEKFAKGRDPMEPIADILALRRPLNPVLEAVKTMLRDLPPVTGSALKRALHFRNALLIALLAANPLRIRQFLIMEFGKHLVKQEDGSRWVQFKKGEFKNRKSIKSDYCVRVAPDVWPLIERYQKEFRPLLAGADTCNYVFRPDIRKCFTKDEKRIKAYNNNHISESALCGAIEQATFRYIPGSPGFRAHAFRHIVATDIIKENPSLGFFLASKALHDKLETVEKEYAHLKTHEFFEPYNTHFAERWSEAMSDGEAGGSAS
jgi:integrase